MAETKLDLWKRKIRNGKRKVLERALAAEQAKMWKKLSELPTDVIRRLKANWTVETCADLTAQHGLDLDDEIANTLLKEINNEILDEVKKAAKSQ